MIFSTFANSSKKKVVQYEESCTVRRIEFGILWILDRFFYQTNFKELFKGMTKNVMNVWVKTMNSTAELCDAMKKDNIR